jgi:hypothetical protein
MAVNASVQSLALGFISDRQADVSILLGMRKNY